MQENLKKKEKFDNVFFFWGITLNRKMLRKPLAIYAKYSKKKKKRKKKPFQQKYPKKTCWSRNQKQNQLH